MNDAHLFRWPVNKGCFAVDEAAFDGAYQGALPAAKAAATPAPVTVVQTPEAALVEPVVVVEEPTPQAQDALTCFERWCRWPVHAALFMFGVVNAGVQLFSLEEGAWAVPDAKGKQRPNHHAMRKRTSSGAPQPRSTAPHSQSLSGCTASLPELE